MSTTNVFNRSVDWSVECGDSAEWVRSLPKDSVHCVVTSPPYYGLRKYLPGSHPDAGKEIGAEDTPEQYVERMVEVFRGVKRLLHPSGLLWLNLGDTYDGSKSLLGIPWLVAFALRSDGWYLRQWCPWVKRSGMPDSASDRPGVSCETVFLLSKRESYFFDMEAVKRVATTVPHAPGNRKVDRSRNDGDRMQKEWAEDGNRNSRNADLWFDSVGMMFAGDIDGTLLGFDVNPKGDKAAHFAIMPKKLIRPMVLAGTSEYGVCPHCGNPWKRVVEKNRQPTRPGTNTKLALSVKNRQREEQGLQSAKSTLVSVAGNRDSERHVTTTRTVGWEPTCLCADNNPVSAIVCDPFAGSGNVLSVAVEQRRYAVGCDLNSDYVRLARRRISNVIPNLI